MGHPRQRPERLAAKLAQVRAKLGLTQEQMRQRLGHGTSPRYAGHISEFESGKREPSLIVLLRYARLAEVTMDVLVDDKLELPDRLNSTDRRTRPNGGRASPGSGDDRPPEKGGRTAKSKKQSP